MSLIIDLFSTDYGLVALAATLVSLALAWRFHAFIRKKIRESESADVSNRRGWARQRIKQSDDACRGEHPKIKNAPAGCPVRAKRSRTRA